MKRLVWIMVLSCIFYWPGPPALPAAEETPSVEHLVRRIEEEFGVKIIYRQLPEGMNPAIIFSVPRPQDYKILANYLMMLREELRKYPECFYQKTGLDGIALVKRQFYDSRPLEGLYQRNTRIIVIDFLRNRGHGIKQRLNVHHELYHMLESQNGLAWRFRDWENINRPGFSYQTQKNLQPGANPVNYFAPPVPGFVTYYAMESPAEDRAELFAALMIDSQRRVVHRWLERDTVLRQKVHALRAAVIALCPEMAQRL